MRKVAIEDTVFYNPEVAFRFLTTVADKVQRWCIKHGHESIRNEVRSQGGSVKLTIQYKSSSGLDVLHTQTIPTKPDGVKDSPDEGFALALFQD